MAADEDLLDLGVLSQRPGPKGPHPTSPEHADSASM